MASIKKLAVTIYNYTHIFVGAGAVVTSFLDTQQLSPKAAAAIVLISQGLKIANDALVAARYAAPVAEKVLASPAAPLEPAVPTPAA